MTNIVVEFLRATARDFTKGFTDTLYDIDNDGTRAKTEGLQYRLRTLRVRMLDGTDNVYQQADDLANRIGRYTPEIDYHRFYVLALLSFGFDKRKLMQVVNSVCPPNFTYEVERFAELVEKEVSNPFLGTPASYKMTVVKQIKPNISY
ncbi:MAG: hypothetical protein HYW22_02795 [Candidatus Aenigmarchaeota archaeon]|nr:hypothetical protein [Candidatus Aenigmarchaeota archaeon]